MSDVKSASNSKSQTGKSYIANKCFVARYGLPVNFQAMLLHPNKKNTKKLRDTLQQMYGHLDSSAQQGGHAAQDVSITVYLNACRL